MGAFSDTDSLGVWSPPSPEEAQRLLSVVNVRGGLPAVGRLISSPAARRALIRTSIFRFFGGTNSKYRRHLAGWECYAARGGPFLPWRRGESLASDVNSVSCRPAPDRPWALELLLADAFDGRWIFRRNRGITLPLEEIGAQTADGLPYLRAEIQLLFKAKESRPKDFADFDSTLSLLSPSARTWLRDSLSIAHPNHPWIVRL